MLQRHPSVRSPRSWRVPSTRGRADALRKLFLDTMRRECSVPLRHAVGNHDILGWNRGRSGMTGSEPDWGKKFACDMFGLERTYHSFDAGGWRFVFPDGVTYVCDGAVSGSWWKGPLQGVPEGFGVVDLRPDGSFEHRYEPYGWTARR